MPKYSTGWDVKGTELREIKSKNDYHIISCVMRFRATVQNVLTFYRALSPIYI